MQRVDSTVKGWEHYELIDSGEGRKLERFGEMILDRPDPQALWSKTFLQSWHEADAQFTWSASGEKWKLKKGIKDFWKLQYKDMLLNLSFGKFKHIGVFPEHRQQWDSIVDICKANKEIRVLNLFGYTGALSIIAAQHGAKVTHIDASKQTIATVKQNNSDSALSPQAIRLVCEDALKYVKRLIQRGEQFEIVVMDPPAFGRGPKGEIWKIEEKLMTLLSLIPQLLSEKAQTVLLNGYASGYSARSFGELLSDALKEKKGTIVYGDVGIQQQNTNRVLSTGIYAQWKV